jgi:hypothetical protein
MEMCSFRDGSRCDSWSALTLDWDECPTELSSIHHFFITSTDVQVENSREVKTHHHEPFHASKGVCKAFTTASSHDQAFIVLSFGMF